VEILNTLEKKVKGENGDREEVLYPSPSHSATLSITMSTFQTQYPSQKCHFRRRQRHASCPQQSLKPISFLKSITRVSMFFERKGQRLHISGICIDFGYTLKQCVNDEGRQ
jgi:hypothetical protein